MKLVQSEAREAHLASQLVASKALHAVMSNITEQVSRWYEYEPMMLCASHFFPVLLAPACCLHVKVGTYLLKAHVRMTDAWRFFCRQVPHRSSSCSTVAIPLSSNATSFSRQHDRYARFTNLCHVICPPMCKRAFCMQHPVRSVSTVHKPSKGQHMCQFIVSC